MSRISYMIDGVENGFIVSRGDENRMIIPRQWVAPDYDEAVRIALEQAGIDLNAQRPTAGVSE